MNKGNSKKIIIICIVCALLGGALIGGMGVMIYSDLSRTESDKKGQTADSAKDTGESTEADQLKDGEVYDFEKAGFMKLGEYKGLEAEVQPEQDDVYSGMIAEAEEELEDDDGIVKDGELVNIDFAASLDGKALEDASGEDAYVRIGKGEYIDDFEKGIIGIKKGEEKTVDCTFPKDYDDGELAGKKVQFLIKVNSRFSDKTAQQLSEGKYKTIDEYYEYEKQLQLKDNQENKGDLVWDSLKEETEITSVSEVMLTRSTEDVTNMYKNFAELSGTTVEELLESFGMGEDGISEIAQDTVADYMIAKTIAAREGITLDDTYYMQTLRELLGYEEGDEEKSLEELEKEYKKDQGSRPKDDVLVERVREYVGEQSKEM